jgi:hypothetical protein
MAREYHKVKGTLLLIASCVVFVVAGCLLKQAALVIGACVLVLGGRTRPDRAAEIVETTV